MNAQVRCYLSEIGRRGGRKSRRVLSSKTAHEMVRLREAKRAFERFQASCFWSYDPGRRLTPSDIPWIVEQLRKHGGRQAREAAERLCRFGRPGGVLPSVYPGDSLKDAFFPRRTKR